jgi:hypothetical protein
LRPAHIALLIVAFAAGSLLLLGSTAAGQDNHTPETAAPLDDHNYLTERVNGSDDEAEYWYYMDIDRGDELFIYFYAEGEGWYNLTRLLYYFYGPNGYGSGDYVHGEYWYRQRQQRRDYTDVWSWICPEGGRYYFFFFAYQSAIGNFHINISRDKPETIYRFGQDSGTLWWNGVNDLNKNDIWRIWLTADDKNVEGVTVTVRWTFDHLVHVYAYDLVDSYEQNMLNLSYAFEGENTVEIIRFTASYTGWYYLRVEYGSWSGYEDYTLSTAEYSAPNDGDNDVDNATHVLKSSSHNGRIEASRDMHDWYAMDLVEGDLLGISMQIMDPNNPAYNPGTANFFNFYEIQVYDPQMRRVGNGYDRNQGWPVPDTYINNLPIQPTDIRVNGTYYFRTSFYWSYGAYYDPTNTSGHIVAFCDYVLQITIPNRAPRVNMTALEDVYMLEDTTWWEDRTGKNVSSLDLHSVFQDPELGVLTFSVKGDANVTARLVDGHKVTLKPDKDWHGDALVALMVEDDSGNDVTAMLRVVVMPVNDPPTIGPPETWEFLEDDPSVENRTFDMYQVFSDVDDGEARNLTFSMEGGLGDLTAEFDQANGNVTFTVHEDVNGDFYLTFTATDSGGLTAVVERRVTVVPVNDAPRPLPDPAVYEFPEGFMLETFNAADHIYDPDGDTELLWFVEYVYPEDEANLEVDNEGKSIWNSDIIIIPASNKHDWFGEVWVDITCTDPDGLSSGKTFQIIIINTPDPPEISAWSPRTDATFGEGETFTFSIDGVIDPDGEDASLHFSFWLRGPDDPKAVEVQNTTGSSWEMTTDFESEGVYEVTVVVFDEDLMSSVSPIKWGVTVTKTNRLPTVTIVAPVEGDTFSEGKWIEFQATTDDPDEEDRGALVVEWYEGDTWLGRGKTFSIKNLKPGTHAISVIVADEGGLGEERTVTITVEKKEEEPGFAGLATLLALVSMALVAALSRGTPGRW